MDAGLDEGLIRVQDISKHVACVPSSVSSLCTDKGTNRRRFNGHPGTPIRWDDAVTEESALGVALKTRYT